MSGRSSDLKKQCMRRKSTRVKHPSAKIFHFRIRNCVTTFILLITAQIILLFCIGIDYGTLLTVSQSIITNITHNYIYKLVGKPSDTKLSREIDKHLSNKIVCFAGQAKDVSRHIVSLLDQINWMANNIFKHTIIIILESNSKDDTRAVIRNWQLQLQLQLQSHQTSSTDFQKKGKIQPDMLSNSNHNLSFILINESLVTHVIEKYVYKLANKNSSYYNESISRMPRYVIYRNFLLQYIKYKNINIFEQFKQSIDYLFLIDFDGLKFEINTILNELISGIIYKNYSAICVNGNTQDDFDRYYHDTFALILNNKKWFHKMHIQPVELQPPVTALEYLNSNRFQNVLSCFGGLTIYNFNKIINNKIGNQCKYFLFSFNKFNKTLFDTLSIYHQYILFENLYKQSNIMLNGENDEYDNYFNQSVYNNKTLMTQMTKDMSRWTMKDRNNDPIIRSKNGGDSYTKDFSRKDEAYITCEHVAFHYCLTQFAKLKIALSRDARYILKGKNEQDTDSSKRVYTRQQWVELRREYRRKHPKAKLY